MIVVVLLLALFARCAKGSNEVAINASSNVMLQKTYLRHMQPNSKESHHTPPTDMQGAKDGPELPRCGQMFRRTLPAKLFLQSELWTRQRVLLLWSPG